LEIEELLQVDTIDWRLPQGFPVLVKSEKDLDRAAKDLRDYWALGSDPIANFQELLEGKGVKVLLHALPSAVAGLTCFVNYKTAKIPVIVVNTEITGERQRFTLAHELGHLVLQEVETTKENEKNCDKFAGAFLMPDNFLFENLGRSRNSISIGELCSLKKNLGVSILAIAMRCKQTGIISSPLSRKLWGQFVSRGYTKHPYKEPDPLELLKKSERIKRLCFRGVTENIIDVEKASLLLKVTPDNIRLQMSHED
jgi:Zn-dependent peptidase ImmA (M78 family)